jgi:hypothetical protein
VFSKLGLPEEVPIQYLDAPVRVGNDGNAITKVATNNDMLYVFKKDEGIYRVEIIPGTSIPVVSNIVQIDNTIWPVQDNSFAETGQCIYFLSNRGVAKLEQNRITILSGAVECDMRDLIVNNASNPTGVRAFANDFLKQVGWYFPTTKDTWVFDTEAGKWSKWGLPFDSSFTDSQHRLLLGTSGYTYAWPCVRRNSYLGDGWFENPSQVDEVVPFTGMSLTASGQNLTLSATGVIDARFIGGVDRIASLYDLTKDKFYLTSGPTATGAPLWEVTYVSSGVNSITFTMPSAFPGCVGITTGYGLVMGVNASITHNRFFISGQAGLTRFSEFHLQMIDGPFTGIKIGFECDAEPPTFATSSFLTCSSTNSIIRLLIPREQARGRWISGKITHTKPYEKFTALGFSYVCSDVNSHKVKRNNN